MAQCVSTRHKDLHRTSSTTVTMRIMSNTTITTVSQKPPQEALMIILTLTLRLIGFKTKSHHTMEAIPAQQTRSSRNHNRGFLVEKRCSHTAKKLDQSIFGQWSFA